MERQQIGGMGRPRWPTLEQQLAEARVTPGSALEKVIREHQDFHILRPEEASDKIGLPPWLRVYWRKQHPEAVYSPGDPSGGYPRVLKNILSWMLTHQDLRPGSLGNAATQTAFLMLEAAAPELVGDNLRISGAQSTRRSESDIRVNYNNTNRVIAASNAIGGSGAQAQFLSTDGGVTWKQTSLPMNPADTFHSDPAVDWTSDGTAWAITIGISGSVLQLRCYKSTGLQKWAFESTPSGAQTNTDKELMWVDHGPTSPFKDNMYVIWHNGQPAFVARRTGIGGPWSAPLQVSGAETTGTAIGGDVKTNGFGDVFAFWPDTGSRKLLVAKSTDGGATFGRPVTIAITFGSYQIAMPANNSRQALIYVSAGAYRNLTKNLGYAVWTDLTGAPGCDSGGGPGSNANSTCKSRIWFSRSADGGATWETPRMINNQDSLNDQFNPRLVVDETNGNLVVIYYDTVNDPARLRTDVWSQTSTDDGITWNTPLKITSAQTDETVAGADSGNQYGDYNGLSGYAGTFFPSWTDRRSGANEEIWTARIRLPVSLPWLSLLLGSPP